MLSRIALWAYFGTLTPLSLTIDHFRVPPGLCLKTRVGAQPLIWKSFFILMQITHFRLKGCAPSLILKVRVLELESGVLQGCAEDWGITCPPKQSHNAIQHNSDPVSRAASKWTTHKEIYKRIQFYCIKCFVLLQEIRGVFGQ